MVRVDQAGGDQAAIGVDRFGRRRGVTVADGLDQAIADRHPAILQLTSLGVERGDAPGTTNHEIGHDGSTSRDSTSAAKSSTVVSGLTTQYLNTVSPCHEVGTTNDCWVANC